jgi:hypothetical protein
MRKMGNIERLREPVAGMPSPEYLEQKLTEGWRPVAIEWERESSAEDVGSGLLKHEVPYGLRVSEDCHHLEDDPAEREVLRLILALIVGDEPLSQVAQDLNRRGHRTRGGSEWTQVAVFNMLPRLIEVAPEILSTREWSTVKQRVVRAV